MPNQKAKMTMKGVLETTGAISMVAHWFGWEGQKMGGGNPTWVQALWPQTQLLLLSWIARLSLWGRREKLDFLQSGLQWARRQWICDHSKYLGCSGTDNKSWNQIIHASPPRGRDLLCLKTQAKDLFCSGGYIGMSQGGCGSRGLRALSGIVSGLESWG